MQYWLDDKFDEKYADMVANIKSDEYYINMMRAWYFATGLAKQFDKILPYLEQSHIDEWTRQRAIQKACESYRVTDNLFLPSSAIKNTSGLCSFTSSTICFSK